MKKMLFIMNPYAGQRKANRHLPDIISLFNRAGYAVTVHMTDGPGDATRIAQELAPGMDLVACCGGDGTFSETVNGLLNLGLEIPLGYIPAGTTNDFAHSLKLSTDIMEAARNIAEGLPSALDVGKFHEKYFTYVASFGAFSRTSYTTPQNVKNALGHTAYILGGISELSQLRTEHIRLELEDQVIEDDFIFGAICNSTSLGGMLTLDPKVVDMTDGKLEVMLVRMPKSLLEISECIQAVQSQKYNCAMITFLSAERMKIICDGDIAWTLDGEPAICPEEFAIENQHLAIRLMQKAVHHA